MLTGKAHKFGDGISTDHIIPGRYAHLRSNLPELARHVLEDADANFVKKVKPGDFVVGGNNFGLGSSREHAPLVIKMAGVSAILARSVARIFYRNAINLGLPVPQRALVQTQARPAAGRQNNAPGLYECFDIALLNRCQHHFPRSRCNNQPDVFSGSLAL